jgi:hypothetical protein
MTWYQPSCVAGSVSSDRFVRVVGQEPFLDAPLRWCIEGRLQWMHAKHPTNSKCANNEVPVSHLQEAIGNPSAVNNTLIVDDPPSGPTSLSDPITSFIATAEEFVRRHKLNTLRPVLVPISCRHRSWMPSSAFVEALTAPQPYSHPPGPFLMLHVASVSDSCFGVFCSLCDV